MHEQLVSELKSMVMLLVIPMLLLGIMIITRRGRKRYPPGPMGLPIIGNIMMAAQLNHRGLAKLAQQYGGLFHLKMGFVHMVVVTSPDQARQVLQVQDSIFSNRPVTIAINYITYGGADMVFAHCTPFWRKIRKLAVMRLFSRKRTETWQSVRDEVDHIIQLISGQTGLPLNLGEHVFNLTKNVIYRAALGSKLDERQDEFLAVLQELSQLFAALNMADFIPFLTWTDPNGLNDRLVKARSQLGEFIDPIIESHLKKKADKNEQIEVNKVDKLDEDVDMVDELLKFYTEDVRKYDPEDPQDTLKLTRDNIKAIIMDVTFGATETVAWTVEWLMTELLCNPEDMKRVQQELTNVVGLTRRAEESDLDKLPFFRCCIKETLRLHPPIPLLLHATSQDTFVGGYYIPKQSRVIINTWAIGRDPKSWSDANMFKPERFQEEGAPDIKGANFEFIPFGSGRRSCPGMGLALYTLELCAVNLLHCFTWKVPEGISELSRDETFGLTISKASRLIAVPSPRLLCTHH